MMASCAPDIAVVDDNPVLLSVLSEIFEECGHTVRAACHMDRISTGDHGLRRRASSVDTSASEQAPFDKCHRLAARSVSACQWRPGLTGSDNDCVKYFQVMSSLSDLRSHRGAPTARNGRVSTVRWCPLIAELHTESAVRQRMP
jgi:hypothetical protein